MRRELRTLSKENAAGVAAHLLMVGRLLDVDLVGARAHAETAVRRAGRVAAAREALGLVAYRSGEWAQALSEFRTARRLSGDQHLLPLMVDCERALGRPERALELASSPEAKQLTASEQMELTIVVSGIRRDLGQVDAALVTLQGPQLNPKMRRPWSARLFYAYADALVDKGDIRQARRWFSHAVDADTELETDASERLDEIDGVKLIDLLEGEDDAYASQARSSGSESANDAQPESKASTGRRVETPTEGPAAGSVEPRHAEPLREGIRAGAVDSTRHRKATDVDTYRVEAGPAQASASVASGAIGEPYADTSHDSASASATPGGALPVHGGEQSEQSAYRVPDVPHNQATQRSTGDNRGVPSTFSDTDVFSVDTGHVNSRSRAELPAFQAPEVAASAFGGGSQSPTSMPAVAAPFSEVRSPSTPAGGTGRAGGDTASKPAQGTTTRSPGAGQEAANALEEDDA